MRNRNTTVHTTLRYYHSFVYLKNYKTAQTIIVDLDSFVDFVIFGRKKDNYSTVIKKRDLKKRKLKKKIICLRLWSK